MAEKLPLTDAQTSGTTNAWSFSFKHAKNPSDAGSPVVASDGARLSGPAEMSALDWGSVPAESSSCPPLTFEDWKPSASAVHWAFSDRSSSPSSGHEETSLDESSRPVQRRESLVDEDEDGKLSIDRDDKDERKD